LLMTVVGGRAVERRKLWRRRGLPPRVAVGPVFAGGSFEAEAPIKRCELFEGEVRTFRVLQREAVCAARIVLIAEQRSGGRRDVDFVGPHGSARSAPKQRTARGGRPAAAHARKRRHTRHRVVWRYTQQNRH